MGHQAKLQADLQAEFSPPLDASLIAAIVADYVNDDDQKLSPEIMQQVRSQLSLLAAQAEQDEHSLFEHLSHFTFDASNSITDDTNSLNDTSTVDTTTAFTTQSSYNDSDASSNCSPRAFSSPLGFLQAAFPDLPTSTLRNSLGSMGDIDDVDMEAVVVSILSKEFIRELEERGLKDDAAGEAGLWRMVEKRTHSVKTPKKHKKPAMTLTFGDVRQQANVRTAATPAAHPPDNTSADPWTQVSSMATYLSDLLPSHSASFFQSMFHSPKYASPSTALRATLASVSPAEVPDDQQAALHGLFELLVESAAYHNQTAKPSSDLLSDASLAFRATQFDAHTALCLLGVMKTLDSDSLSGNWGLFHSPVPVNTISNNVGSPLSPIVRNPPSDPPSIPPPPVRCRSVPQSPVSLTAWQTVTPTRRSTSASDYAHADFIPAYNTGKKAKMRGSGKRSPADADEFKGKKGYSVKVNDLMKQRTEALREASRAWQRGSNKTRGGEVAQFYAAKAHELSQQVHTENQAAAFNMVYAKRQLANNCMTIDLHGTTVAEAVSVVERILLEEPPTEAKPLKVITGRGRHSANGISVLAPAVKAALVAGRWNVGTWEAGLIVRGSSTS